MDSESSSMHRSLFGSSDRAGGRVGSSGAGTCQIPREVVAPWIRHAPGRAVRNAWHASDVGWIATLSTADAAARLVVIPAGYGLGAWVGATAGYVLHRGDDTRERWRDWMGVLGGAAGLGVWIGQVAGG